MKRKLLAAIAGAASVALIVPQAHAEGQIYSGYGWEAISYVQSINSSNPFVINFGSESAKTVLRPYAEKLEVYLENATGAEFSISDSPYLDGTPSCSEQPYHVITLRYRAMDHEIEGHGRGVPCVSSVGSLWGGWIFIDASTFTVPGYFDEDPVRNESIKKNIVTHEVGHAMGLSHPNPVDENGNDIKGDCVPDALQPVMCERPWPGGYMLSTNAGKYTWMDVDGLEQLVANYNL